MSEELVDEPRRTLRGRLRGLIVDRRISTKIVGVSLIVSSIFATIAVIGLTDIRELAAQQEIQYQQNVVALSHMSTVRSAVSSQQEAVLSHILSEPGFYRQRYAEVIRQTDVQINAELVAMHRIEEKRQPWAKLRGFEDVLEMWLTVRATAISASDTGDRQKATAIVLVRSEAIATALKERANDFLDQLVTDVADGVKASQQRSERSGRLMLILLVAGAVVAFALSVWAARSISRPIRQVMDVLGRVAKNDLSHRMVVDSFDEVGQMGRSLNETLGVLRRAFDQLHHRASHDGLTGLANRTLLRDRMDNAAKNARMGKPVAVLLIDLDGFKKVNDVHGHAAGDHLLTVVAERLMAGVRGADTVARLGGDEFAVLLDGMDAAEDVYAVADRLLADLKKPTGYNDTMISPQASIGVALWSGEQSIDELMRDADLAMYAAKSAGKGKVMGAAAAAVTAA